MAQPNYVTGEEFTELKDEIREIHSETTSIYNLVSFMKDQEEHRKNEFKRVNQKIDSIDRQGMQANGYIFTMRDDMQTMKTDILDLKTRVDSIDSRMTNLESRMTSLEDRMTNIEATLTQQGKMLIAIMNHLGIKTPE